MKACRISGAVVEKKPKRYYGLREPYERKPRIRRPRPKPAPQVIGRHGSLTIVEVRDERGRRSIRYVR